MRVILRLACLLLVAMRLHAATYNVKMIADNYYAAYTGNSTAALTQHFTGAWGSPVTSTNITTTDPYLYVAAWDDGGVYQGLLASVQSGTGIINTGSPLWEVCAANQTLGNAASNAPSLSALSAKIAACNSGGWHATAVGPNNGNAQSAGFWPAINAIDLTAAWIWNTDRSTTCAGTNNFLRGGCNPGEYLIFRLPLERVPGCLPPTPSFTMVWNNGFGTVFADGTASQNEQNHFWSVQLSNASWGRFGTEVMSWFNGQAGPFDIKTFFENGTNTKMKCDAYYRVKLAVANECVSWRDVSQLIHINCCPGDVTPQK